jgi:hypothetical protein
MDLRVRDRRYDFLNPVFWGAQSFKIVPWGWDEDEGPPFISELLPSSGTL